MSFPWEKIPIIAIAIAMVGAVSLASYQIIIRKQPIYDGKSWFPVNTTSNITHQDKLNVVSGMVGFNLIKPECPEGWRSVGTATIELQNSGEMLAYIKSRNLYNKLNIEDGSAAGRGHNLLRSYLCFFE